MTRGSSARPVEERPPRDGPLRRERRGRRGPTGPLARRSPLRLLRGGPWTLLVATALVLLGAAAAAPPMFTSAADNAALTSAIDAVPSDAVANQAPVVRVVGGGGESGRRAVDEALTRVTGLSAGTLTGASSGVETRPKDDLFSPFVSTGGDPVRARLFGDDNLMAALIPADGSPGPGTTRGVWLPEPVATDLGIGPGDQVTVGVTSSGRAPQQTTSPIAGVYRVGPGGRLPEDRPGSRIWRFRAGSLPKDSEFRTLSAYLVIGDVPTVAALSTSIGDGLLYVKEAQLDPADPTLEQARETVAGLRRMQVFLRDPAITGAEAAPLRAQVVSGLPDLVEDAGNVAGRTAAWTAALSRAGTGLGLMVVLAVAVLGLVRRAGELRLSVDLGLRPTMIGLLAAVELLLLAMVGAALGTVAAWVVMTSIGPPGEVSADSVRAGAMSAALASGVGVLLVGATAALAARRAASLGAGSSRARAVPAEAVLLAVAVTGVAGLLARPAGNEPPSGLDLLVPLTVVAATGAVGGRLALLATSRTWRRRAVPGARPGPTLARPVPTLARRRAAAGGTAAVLVVTVLATGFGMLAYSLGGASSVRQVTDDRVVVLSGATATSPVDASWLLDDGAAQLPPPVLLESGEEEFVAEQDTAPVEGTRSPPLPDGLTVVWRSRVNVPPDLGQADILVVDPEQFARFASWGQGPELARARDVMAPMAREDDVAAAALVAGEAAVVPAIAVGDIAVSAGEITDVTTEGTFSLVGNIAVRFLDVVEAFPGDAGNLDMVVVPADSFFSALGIRDPRVRPPDNTGRLSRPPANFLPEVWSSGGADPVLGLLAERELPTDEITTAGEVAQRPDTVAARRSLGYQQALGWCLAGIAVLTLGLYADRVATRSRAADLMLVRMGLGRSGTLLARVMELAGLTAVSLALGLLGVRLVAPLGGRLLDPGGGAAPDFVLRLGWPTAVASVAAAMVAVLVAVAVAVVRARTASAGEVLRDAA